MTTVTYAAFFTPVQLGAVASILYPVPSSPTSLLRGGRIRATNATGAAVTVTFYAVPTAGSPVAANAFVLAKSVPANDFLDVDVPILPSGATLQGLAGAATSITVHMINGALFS